MKSQPAMESTEDAEIKTSVSRDKEDGEDTEDDEDNDHAAVGTSVADLCSASHEFEWLTSSARGLSYEKTNDGIFSDQANIGDEQAPSCQTSPARSTPGRQAKQSSWSRRSNVIEHMRMLSSPYNELYGCRRHLSPMRSSWCCPSPPPHSVCMHHGCSLFSDLELFGYDCYGSDAPCLNCSCLPPTGRSQDWCRNTQDVTRSPCGTHRPCQVIAGARRSRSVSSRKRDCSPSALSPRCSPIPNEQVRHSNQDQWQIPFSSNELNINSSFKVHQLESDKKNLILQTSVLADQVDAQANKISELERILDQKKDEMLRLEQNLHQEMLARSSVENSKLELMTKLSNLRLRLTAAERDRRESDDKYRKLENELLSFQAQISDNENEQALLRGKLSRNGNHMLPSADNSEMEKLKSALHSVIVSNNEKDQKIEDLRCSLTKYKKLQVLSNHTKKISDSLRGRMHEPGFICNYSCNDGLQAPVNDNMCQTLPINYNLSTAHSPIETLDKNFSNLQTNISAKSSLHRSNSEDNLCPLNAATVITSPHYETMPRQSGSHVLQQSESKICETDPDSLKKVLSLKGIDCSNDDDPKTQNSTDKISGDNVESSVVTFAVEECVTIPSAEKEHADYVAPITPQPFLIKGDKDKKGFMKLFSKWKKTGSQNIDRIEDFKRGGIRATAGARLGWSRDVAQEPDIPFTRWNTDMVVEWLHRLGLSAYASECKRWMCTADMLIKASANDLEKELGIKNPLHKKKLVLAIKSLSSGLPNLPQSINKLDHHWVIRWLDDIGLPQYKDAFSDARVDGRVLHCLTIEDLLFMKVTNLLHHISISRGIQLLREKGFDPQCLVRRSLPDESKSYTPQLVSAWSNHRVMEWLRTVDLSEYAPNLRGSGVHGALIIYEVRFNTNLFATLLNIPPTKTLLRRHLATHFKNIVGEELTQLKREKETDTALTPSIKVKTSRKTQFALIKKRNKSEFENEDYVCPMEIKVIMEPQKSTEGDKLIVRRNSDPSPQDQRQIDLKTVHQDENLNESPTTIV